MMVKLTDKMAIADAPTGVGSLGSTWSKHRLDQINEAHINGINESISQSQIVVCGDTASGKSSVLERLTGIPFSRMEGNVIKFPIEMVFRHTDRRQQITATIRPHSKQCPIAQEKFRGYTRDLSNISELPAVMDEMISKIILYDKGSRSMGAITADTLRIEVKAAHGLHLSIIDLPGSISRPKAYDIEGRSNLLQRLAESYLSDTHSIILAVIEASNVTNHGVMGLAQKFDPEGQRTLGVITKTDSIKQGAEYEIAKLAKNMGNHKPELGYFLLMNPITSEREAGLTLDAQSRMEMRFFSKPAWKTQRLFWHRVGVENLKLFLRDLLEERIEVELPNIWEATSDRLSEAEQELKALGDQRSTVSGVRVFMTGLAMHLSQLTRAALDGNYHELSAEFFSGPKNRLRTEVHTANKEFANYMHDNGQWRKITTRSGITDNQLLVTKEEMIGWVKSVYERHEDIIPGVFQSAVFTELFKAQSSRWSTIAKNHVDKVFRIISNWITRAVSTNALDGKLLCYLISTYGKGLDQAKDLAYEELEKLLKDEKLPIMNHRLHAETIQHVRNKVASEAYATAVEKVVRKRWGSDDKLITAREVLEIIRSKTVVGLDKQAHIETIALLDVYYKAALSTFIDNVCRQVVERHLLSALPSIFSPQGITELSEEELFRISSETVAQRDRRAQLESTVNSLRKNLADLQRYSIKA
ncbi:putative dynamin GTPase [Hypoxylon trugodes]|uniref:putative dynamin GTPase n=1 Tax=Hypoxylon trugodes TaxID=326681 RepID=UPI00219F0100|nr:putative dynamin GTPase [Hypoxylon trugodes]KAI1388975.1 putative dynamin GTPase [Hypoxylon trugodes]